jgi:hypothetical protein
MKDAVTSKQGSVAGPYVAALAVIALATALRLIPCFDDFWLDEIWAYFFAREIHGPLGVFTEIHHSNNHHLMSLFMVAIGDQRHWVVYRIPSLLAGVGTIPLAAAIARRRGRLEAVFAGLLTSFAFVLIQYSSEARGYASVIFFALAAYLSLTRFLERPTRLRAFLFGGAVVLGVLSQLIFVFFYLGAFLWSLVRLHRTSTGKIRLLRNLAALHTAPALALGALYWVDLRHMQVGAGEPISAASLLAASVGSTLGLPMGPLFAVPAGILLVGTLGLSLWRLRVEKDDSWWFYLVTIVVAPAVVLLITKPEMLAVRYFVVGAAFYLILVGFLLADLWRLRPHGRQLAGIAMVLFLFGNGVHIAAFLRDGRGSYLKAARLMAAQTPGRTIRVGLDHEFRTGLTLRYYARYLSPEKEIEFYPRDRWPKEGPDWILTHSVARPEQAKAFARDPYGNTYTLAGAYDAAGLSGFYWRLYRKGTSLQPPPAVDR